MLGLLASVFILMLVTASILSDPVTSWDRAAVVVMWLAAGAGGLRGGGGEAVIGGLCGAVSVGAAWLFWMALQSAWMAW